MRRQDLPDEELDQIKRYLSAILSLLENEYKAKGAYPLAKMDEFSMRVATLTNKKSERDLLRADLRDFINHAALGEVGNKLLTLADKYYPDRDITRLHKYFQRAKNKSARQKKFDSIKENTKKQFGNITKDVIAKLKSSKQPALAPANKTTYVENLNNVKYKRCFTIGFLGDDANAKNALRTCYIQRFALHTKSGICEQIGNVEVGVRPCDIPIYDPRGVSHLQRINNRANVMLICFDVTNRETFENAFRWQQEHQRYGTEDTCCLLVGLTGNLIDQKRVVERSECEDAAHHAMMTYHEVNEMTGAGVIQLFKEATLTAIASHGRGLIEFDEETLRSGIPQDVAKREMQLAQQEKASGQHYKTRAVHGLFEHKGISRDAASLIAKHLTPTDAANVAGSSKNAHERAEQGAEEDNKKNKM